MTSHCTICLGNDIANLLVLERDRVVLVRGPKPGKVSESQFASLLSLLHNFLYVGLSEFGSIIPPNL